MPTKQTIIHFVSNKELDILLGKMKQHIFYDRSKSEMIRSLLFAGIEVYKKDNVISGETKILTGSSNKQKKSYSQVSKKDNLKILSKATRELIKQKREEYLITSASFAEMLNIPTIRYEDIENGETAPTKEEIRNIKDIFGIDFN